MQALLTVIVTWLSVNFGLPAVYEHPHVEFASAAQMAELRYSRFASSWPDPAATGGRSAPAELGDDVHAIYDDQSRTIYLPEGWTGATAADSSLLVHELVHHLQNVAGMSFACGGEREKEAYQAQARWLELFGKSLVDEFKVDTMTILVRTSCMH